MKLFSSNDPSHTASFEEACLRGLAPNRGLYMPTEIPKLPRTFIDNLKDYSLPEIAFEVGTAFLQNEIPTTDFKDICLRAFDFPAPIVKLSERLSILELFHGPSLAFKDFGARFMAQIMSYFNRHSDQKLIILVATSGDTGGAVAAGFYNTPGIEVVILYPKGRVSELQELQLTTLGDNIHTLQIDGAFDDCQDLVKTAFNDESLNRQLRLSSANSINIARLLPQSFYYFESYKQILESIDGHKKILYAVPSGNFGNLTAGLFAKKMGLPIKQFLACTNANDIVPNYLEKGTFAPKESVATISNAMDVGNPSNFVRMELLYASLVEMQKDIVGFRLDDPATRLAIRNAFISYTYILDPHTAIAFEAADRFTKSDEHTVILSTAHPAKFLPTVEKTLERSIEVPSRLSSLRKRKKHFTPISSLYTELRNYLLDLF